MSRLLLLCLLCAGCTVMQPYKTPNNFGETPAELLLTNGEIQSGSLIVRMRQFPATEIKFKPEGTERFQKYRTEDVVGYRTAEGGYMLKKLRGPGFLGAVDWFVKRLTPPDSRIHLFEYLDIEAGNTVSFGGPGVPVNRRIIQRYFLSLPNDTTRNIYALGSNKFTPDFDEKMSALVSDCPELARKIADKQDGYFYSDLSNVNTRLPIINTIIEEYNRCR